MSGDRTEDAIAAFHQALGASGRLPAVTRNEVLGVMLETLDAATDVTGAVNLVDGEGAPGEVQLGQPRLYEIAHTVTVEVIVRHADNAARDAQLTVLLDAIATVVEEIEESLEAGEADYSGIVDEVEILAVNRSNLATDGVAGLKAAEVLVRLQFTSPRPF